MSSTHLAEKKPTFSISDAAKVVAAFGITGGVLMHLIGYVTYMSYTRTWGFDSQFFPKSIEWFGVQGYYAVLKQLQNGAAFANQNFTALFVGCALFIVSIVLLLLLNSWTDRFMNRLEVLSKWKTLAVSSSILIVSLVIFIPSALTSAFLFLAVPHWLGWESGKAVAVAELSAFKAGCKAKVNQHCLQLVRHNKTVAEGFLIDSSLSHMAVYIPSDNLVKIVERDGIEVVTIPTVE